jgi:glucokinase
MTCIGIEIGGTKLQSAVVGADGSVRATRLGSVDPEAGAGGILAALSRQLAELVSAPAGAAIEAVGIGFGGPVDRGRGTIATSHHVAGWDGFPLAEWVGSRCGGLPVFLENDTNSAALAEAVLGAGRGLRTVVYSNAGSGIGAGFVVDGELYHGRVPGEMELGHLRVGDGISTLEDVASGWAIDRQVAAAAAAHPRGLLAREAAAGRPGARGLAAALAADDAAARAILEAAARQYGFALSHVVHLLNPEVIVLGGGVARLGEPWRDAVARHLDASLMAALRPAPPVRLAALGDAVVPIGAALVAARGRLGRSAGMC